MHRRRLPLRAGTGLLMLLLVLLLAGTPGSLPAAGAPRDAVPEKKAGSVPGRLESCGLPLRWDNIEGAPFLVEGGPLRFCARWGLHVVDLRPGEGIKLLLPAQGLLRIQSPARILDGGDIQVLVSDGSGLQVRSRPVQTTEETSLVVAPDSPAPCLVELRRGGRVEAPLTLALFVSRVEFEPRRLLYGSAVGFPAAGVSLDTEWSCLLSGQDAYWSAPAGAAGLRSVDLEGPATLVLETRLLYPPEEARARQSYDIRFSVDGITRGLHFETTPDAFGSSRTQRGGLLAGARRSAVLLLEQGLHRVEIDGDSDAAWRLLRCADDDYLLQPAPDPPLVRGSPEAPGGILSLLQNPSATAGGGLLVAMYYRRLARRLAAHPEDRAAWLAIRRRYARFRDVYPDSMKPSDELFPARVSLPRLLAPGEDPEDIRLSLPQVLQARAEAPSTVFLQALEGREERVYVLPERPAPSLLRILVARPAFFPSNLALQLDDDQPIIVRILPGSELPALFYRPGRIQASLSHDTDVLSGGGDEEEGHPSESTTASPHERLPTALPWIQAGCAVLPLPRSRRTLRIRAAGAGTPPMVAVQILAARPFRLTEREYLEAATAASAGRGAPRSLAEDFQAWYARRGTDLRRDSGVLAAHRQSLYRLLASQVDRLVATPPVRAAPPDERARGPGRVAARAAAEAASRYEERGEWLPALEAWQGVLGCQDAELERRARLERVTALEELGEQFLARQVLRGLWLRSTDPELQAAAFRRLTANLEPAGDSGDLLAIVSVAATSSASSIESARLAECLAARGKHAAAMDVLLALPVQQRPAPLLLSCARRLGWWATYDAALARVSDAKTRNTWQGLRLISEGKYAEALRALGAAGERGAPIARRLRCALAIRRRLGAPELAVRARAILDWESWWADQDGPRTWATAPNVVRGAAAGVSLRSTARDLREQYFEARSQAPVRVRLSGPAKLRIEARPLHPAGSDAPLNAWILVEDRERLIPLAVTRNLPARGIEAPASMDERPGRKVVKDVDLGPGLHDIAVRPRGARMLIRFRLQEPEIDLGVLPRPSQRAAAAVVASRGTAARPAEDPEPYGCRLLVRDLRSGSELELPIAAPAESLQTEASELPAGLDPVLAARVAMRLGSRSLLAELAGALRELAGSSGGAVPAGVAPEERLLALGWLADTGAGEARLVDAVASFPPQLREPVLLAAGQWREVLAFAGRTAPQDVLRRMERIVFVAEMDPALSGAARTVGEALFRNNPRVPGLQALSRRLLQGTAYKRVTSIRGGAGFHSEAPAPWRPENPALRVRAALLEPLASGERLLAGRSTLGFLVDGAQPSTLSFVLRTDSVEGEPPAPLTVSYRIDDGGAASVALETKAPRAITVSLAAGRHAVRFRLEDPVANQYVRITLRDAPEGVQAAEDDGGAQSVLAARRRYFVSTRERPVRLMLEGPGWLRVDELREGFTLLRYRRLKDGWQEVVLKPPEGRKQAFLRAFVRVPVVEGDVARLRRSTPEPAAVPAPSFQLGEQERIGKLELRDGFSLGGQEDGTLSLGSALRRRAAFDEDGENDVDDYFELKGTHRGWFAGRALHLETSLLGRIHRQAGPSVGLEGEAHYRIPGVPLVLRLQAAAYAQWPEGAALLPEGSTEWSGTVRAGLSHYCRLGRNAYHVPSLSVFGRYVSIDSAGEYPGTVLDIDVYSDYKKDHPDGLVLSETFGYRPWRDTHWWARVAMTTNEAAEVPVVDHATGWVGWRQYLRGTFADVGYRVAGFFADEDRESTYVRHAIFFKLGHDFWAGPRHRLELGIEYRHDFPDNRNLGMVSLVWHFSGGRQYEDFWPTDVRFLRLRRERASRLHNDFTGGDRDE